MKEVYPGIFMIVESARFRPSGNIFVLAGQDGLIFDSGYGNKKLVKQFLNEFNDIEEHYKKQNKVFNISCIIVSHAHSDHFSGLSEISSRLGLKIVLTKDIASKIKDEFSFNKSFQADDYEDNLRIKKNILRRIWQIIRNLGEGFIYKRIFGLSYLNKPDMIVEDNSEIIINEEKWRILPSPGHSPDHISLYNEEKGVIFSGDNVLNMRSTWLGPPESNIEDYLGTIRQIQNLPNLKLILPSHGDVITNPKETLSAILHRMKEREEQLLKAIKQHSVKGLSPENLIKIIYPKEKKIIKIIARDWVVLMLKYMETKGLIKRQIKRNKIMFYPIER
jgi:glyoxylase-like metal-dependent hydrolase (beta-lactamase superfamily II)